MQIVEIVEGSNSMLKIKKMHNLPGLGAIAVEDLIGSEKVQFAMALLKHVDSRQPAC